MIVVIQRVSRACVRVERDVVGQIGRGLLLLAAVEEGDTQEETEWCARKIGEVRLFSDPDGKMNLSVRDVGGEVLAVSQFTLVGDLRKGTRPSFSHAARPDVAEPIFDLFVRRIRESGLQVSTGVFAAMMEVELVNDGPVTILVDIEKGF
jgi:D-tyrosyl-tRNA(Tyr) deacylase